MAKAIPFPGMEEEKPKNNINVKAIPFPDMQMNTEQNISQPVNQPQPQYNDGNIFTDTAKDFAGGSARLFGNIANGARWLGKFVYSAAAQPQNAFAELTGNEQMKVDSSDAFKIPGFNLIEEGLDSFSDASNQAAETIFDSKSMESKQLGNNMIESLKEGRFMDFGKQLVSVTAQTAPNILLAMMGGFAGTAAQGLGATSTAGSMLGTSNVLSQALPKAVIGLSAAGGEYRETEGDPELSDQQELLSAGVKGASEVIWESLVTLPMIDDIVRTNKIAGDQMQKGIEWGLANWLKSGAKGGLSEAGEEMGTEATNYISDVIIKGKQFNADEFTSLVANAGLGAIATGAILSSVGDYRQNNAQNLRYDINQIIKAERMMEDLKREARYERNQKEQRRIEKISRQLNQKKTEMQQQEEMERQRQQSGEATQNAFQGFQGTMAEQKAAAVAKQRILENLINNQQDLNTFTVNIDNNNYAIVRNMNDNILVDVFQGNQRQGTMTAESMEELFTVLANNGYDLSTVTPFETATREQVQQAEIAENQQQAAQNLLNNRQRMINDIVGRINQYGGQIDLSQYDMPTAADDVDTVRQKSLNVLSDLRKQLVEARQNYTPQPQQQGDVAQTPIEQPNNVDNTNFNVDNFINKQLNNGAGYYSEVHYTNTDNYNSIINSQFEILPEDDKRKLYGDNIISNALYTAPLDADEWTRGSRARLPNYDKRIIVKIPKQNIIEINNPNEYAEIWKKYVDNDKYNNAINSLNEAISKIGQRNEVTEEMTQKFIENEWIKPNEAEKSKYYDWDNALEQINFLPKEAVERMKQDGIKGIKFNIPILGGRQTAIFDPSIIEIEQSVEQDNTIEQESQTDEGLNTQKGTEQPVEQPIDNNIQIENDNAQQFINQAQQQPVGDIDEGLEPFIMQTASSAYRVLTPEGNVKNYTDFFDALEQAADTRNYYEENRVNIQQPIQEGQQQQEGIVEDEGQQEYELNKYEKYFLDKKYQDEGFSKKEIEFWREKESFNALIRAANKVANKFGEKAGYEYLEKRAFSEPTKKVKAEDIDTSDIPIEISPNDLDNKLLISAFRGTSHTPKDRADLLKRSYINHIKDLYNELNEIVGNETQRKVLTDELQKYKENYIKKLNDYLSSQSRVSSPMIAGPANFNTRQNDKRAKAAQNKRKAMVEWQEKAKKSIRRKIKKQEGEVVGEQQENEIELTPKDKKQIKEAGRKAYNYVKKTSKPQGKVVTPKMITKSAEKARQEAEIEERQKIIRKKRETAISNAIKTEDKQRRKTENENRKTGSAALTEWGQEIADREIITAIYDLVKGDLDRITIDIEEGNISKDKVNQILDKAREVEMLNEPTYNFYKERFNNVETTENQQFKQDLYDKQTTEFEEIFNKAREAGLEISKDEFDLPNSQASVDDIGREYNKAIDEIEKRLEEYQSEQVEEFAQEKAQERMEEIEDKSRPTRQDTLEYRLWQHINGDINSDELFDNLKIVKRSKTRDILGSYTDRKDMIKDLIEKSKNFNQTIKINTPGGYIEIENKPPIYSEREKGKVVTPRGPLVISDIIMALGGTDQSGVFKGETVKTGKPDIDTSQLAEPNNYYIFDNEGEFVQVLKAKPISIPGTEDMDLFRYRIKDQVGKIKNKKTTTPPNYWIITEGKSGAKMSVGRTIKEAAKNLKESFDKTPVETIKSKVNDLIKEGNISPRWGKIIRYEVGNENNNVKKSIETNKTLFGKEPKNININGKNVKMSRNAVEFSQKNKYARSEFTLNDKRIEMPELLDIILALSEGKYPGIIKKLSNTGTLGYYMPKDGSIGLNPDIFIGPTIHQEKIPNKQYDRRIQEIRTRIENDPEIGEVEFKTKFTKNYVEVRVLEVDPEFAAQTMSHELGHLIDFIPRSELDEGELMDNMSLIYKGEKDETLDAIRDSKKLGPRLKKELQRLSQKWKPFDTSNKKYRQYRFSPEELYADAMSVFFLDPEMLQQEAPLFSQFIQKSISEKPAVKKSYNTVRHLMENRSEMINKTFDNLQEGMVDGVEQTKKKIQRRERGVKSGFDWLIESFIDKNSALYKYFRGEYSDTGEKGRLSREARNKMEEIAYMSSEVEDYLYNIGQIIEGLSNYDIDFLDFNSFLFNKRVLGDRRKYANPLFVNTVRAEEMQQALLDKYGEEKYQKIVNAAEKYYQLRQERIIPIMEKSNMFTEAAMEKVKNNKEYVTFEVVDYINTEFGEGTGDIIMRQYGTGRKISNPLVATMLKDMSIISSIRINESKVAAVKALKKIAPESIRQAPTKEIYGKIIPKDSTDADEGLITFTVNGKLDGYLVEKEIADLYKYEPHKPNAATNTILSIVQGMKSITVSHSPRWMIFNIPRDFFATVMNNPEIGIKDIPALAHEYKKAFSEAWNNVRHNKRSEDISYMRRNRMLTIDRMYRPSDSYMEDDTQQLLTEIFDYNEQSGEEHSRLQKLIPDKVRSAWEGLDNFGQVLEMTGQIAGYRMLKNMTNLSEGDLAHRVRTRVGTPDFKQRGALHSITNNLFIFSTIRKSGWTAAAESFRQNPGTFLFKLALFSLLPKLLQLGAEEADELFPNSEFAKKIAETMEGVSEYKKETYLVVPVWKANGKAITIQLPQDFIGQAVTSLVYNAARGEWGDVAGTAWTELPWNTSNLNPLLQAAADVQRLTSGENIYDTWRGRNVISEEAMLTGNVGQKLKEFGLYEFFNLGGSAIVNPSIAYADGTLEALSNIIPFNAVKRLISVSESGYYEDVTKVYQDQKKYTQMVANYNNSRRYGEDLRYSRKEIMEAKRNLSQLNKLIRHFANINRQIKYAQSQGKKETVDKLERQKINLARRYNGKEPLSD